MSAPPSFIIWRQRCLFPGFSARDKVSAFDILLLRSDAAAFVNVTTRIRLMSASLSGSVTERIILSVSVVVFPEPAAALHRRDVFPEKRVAAIEPRPLWADHHLWRTGRSGGCHVWRPAVLCSGCRPCLGVQPAPSCATLPPCSGCRWSSDRLCWWSGAPAPSVAMGARKGGALLCERLARS